VYKRVSNGDKLKREKLSYPVAKEIKLENLVEGLSKISLFGEIGDYWHRPTGRTTL
jgi:hypothetical protein